MGKKHETKILDAARDAAANPNRMVFTFGLNVHDTLGPLEEMSELIQSVEALGWMLANIEFAPVSSAGFMRAFLLLRRKQ